MTAAKMILHDWQRGKIPFFVPPPQQEGESSEKPDSPEASTEPTVISDRTAAAMKAIAGIISSQQQMRVPSHELFKDDKSTDEKMAEPVEDVSLQEG